jgi:hypothetical protein
VTVLSATNGALVRLPEYHQGPTNGNSSSSWEPIDPATIPDPAQSALAGVDLSNPSARSSVVVKDSDPVWTTPGPVAGPFYALLGDGSFVTYYWYRFADQPALLKADMTPAEREQIQLIAEKFTGSGSMIAITLRLQPRVRWRIWTPRNS